MYVGTHMYIRVHVYCGPSLITVPLGQKFCRCRPDFRGQIVHKTAVRDSKMLRGVLSFQSILIEVCMWQMH